MRVPAAAFLVALCCWLAACAPVPVPGEQAGTADDAPSAELLVMLRSPPAHFRPDATYVAAYDARGARATRAVAMRLARHYRLELVDAWPMPALALDCFVMRVPDGMPVDAVADAIARDTEVESAQRMHVFRVLGHNDPLYSLQPSANAWHLAEVHRVATGRNVRIAQIDTGVDREQPDLRDRIELARNFADTPMAPELHGTAVAGIIGARADDGIGIAGVAPDAILDVLRACHETPDGTQASCTTFALARALQFALEQHIRIINLSLGGPRDRLLERLLDVALAQHVIIVAAIDENAPEATFPASHPGVLAVATDRVSRRLAAGALIAPGHDVPTTLPGARWGLVDGSSYAAAHVSGAAALLLEGAPGLTAAQVRDALHSTRMAVASGRAEVVDVCSALARTTNACVCKCAVARAADSAIWR